MEQEQAVLLNLKIYVEAYLMGGCGESKRHSRLPVSPSAVGGTALKTAASSPPLPAP